MLPETTAREKGTAVDVGGVVLTGGQSRRMGRAKALLPFGDEVMLTRVIRLLSEVVDHLVIVAAMQQELPELADTVQVVRDRREGRGPLEGLYRGMEALRGRVDVAYVTACDVPLLRPGFVQFLIAQMGSHDVVVPVEGTFHHPLAAVYRTTVVDVIADCLARDELRMISFYEKVRTLRIDVQQLRAVDPELHSLMNLNRPEDYETALRLATDVHPKGHGPAVE